MKIVFGSRLKILEKGKRLKKGGMEILIECFIGEWKIDWIDGRKIVKKWLIEKFECEGFKVIGKCEDLRDKEIEGIRIVKRRKNKRVEGKLNERRRIEIEGESVEGKSVMIKYK